MPLASCRVLLLAGALVGWGACGPEPDPGGGGLVDPCAALGERCDQAGAGRCAPDGAETCVSMGSCQVWSAPAACDAGSMCVSGRCQGCGGAPGTFHDRSLLVDGEDRHYYL